jgi:hypothetical protein
MLLAKTARRGGGPRPARNDGVGRAWPTFHKKERARCIALLQRNGSEITDHLKLKLCGLFEGAFDEGEAALGLFAQEFFLFGAFAQAAV